MEIPHWSLPEATKGDQHQVYSPRLLPRPKEAQFLAHEPNLSRAMALVLQGYDAGVSPTCLQLWYFFMPDART
jgi:hypothetical protein